MFDSYAAQEYADLIQSVTYNMDNIAFYQRRIRDLDPILTYYSGAEKRLCEQQITRYQAFIAKARADIRDLVRM